MEGQGIGRREILRTVGVAAGGVALATGAMTSTAHAEDDHDDDHDDDDDRRRKINGSWMVTAVGPDETSATLVVASFATGGVAISHEIQPAGPPFTGTWAQKGRHRFQATLWTGFPGDEGPGSPGNTAKLHVEGNLLGDGTIDGTFTATEFDATTGESQTFTGTFTGVRIRADD